MKPNCLGLNVSSTLLSCVTLEKFTSIQCLVLLFYKVRVVVRLALINSDKVYRAMPGMAASAH
jgi:hypothetical protein